ncbi:MAG TPA: L-threonylcarbamoyladenylate synthase [bacterium]|nr:L-threonylcarbamoyladenylate synthase [bacterium]HQG44343.1 L-threonylcarbamoyladenylate synthase [bacterium]HQI49281.1 L-threonylcarbamoyladenylate synthase [bacterium]HQJ63289.1 L-threonylcarbamoyladenylate synthase [bacterium]
MSELLKIDPRQPEDDLISRAVRVLKQDGVIGYPTETVYGIGSNIFSSAAVDRIYSLKNRDHSKALIVITADLIQISDLVEEIPESAERLMENFWPGPLTLVFRAGKGLQGSLFYHSRTIAIRIPDCPICLALLKSSGFPIISTSANRSGELPATTAAQVQEMFGDQLDMIIDGSRTLSTTPSTVVDVTRLPVRILREGAISKLEIDTVLESV